MIKQLCKLVLVSALGLSVVGCSPKVKEHNDFDQSLEKRSNPPYFLIGEKCALPEISPTREALQTAVMTRLAAGIDRSHIEAKVFETGIDMAMMCPGRGERVLEIEKIPLYLTHRHLEPAKKMLAKQGEFCAGGEVYTGIVSSLSPERLYGEARLKIQCVALMPETVLTYGVRVCVKEGKMERLDIKDVHNPIFGYGLEVGESTSKSSPYCR